MESRDQAIAAQIEAAALKRIEADDLVLPALPAVVGKALSMLRKRDFSFNGVAAAIAPDPLVAARVIRLVNSAGMATREPAGTIMQAVSRLGQSGLQGFLIEISARSVFESHDRSISQAAHAMWEHSLAVALLSRDVAITVDVDDPENAYLAGLLHDIGKPVVAAMLLDAEKRLRRPGIQQAWLSADIWIALIARSHRKVGVSLATRWELPETAQRALREWGTYDQSDPKSVANIVRFANAVVKAKGMYVGPVDKVDNDAVIDAGAALVGVPADAVNVLAEALPELVRERLTI